MWWLRSCRKCLPTKTLKPMQKRLAFILLIIVTVSFLTGCAFIRQSIAVFSSTDDFVQHKNDSRVLFEPGAEAYADKIVAFLPTAIRTVEEKQYRSFAKPVRVYVCASRESFIRMYGADVRAGVLTKLFLSPRIFDAGDEIASRYLTHELSHLHIQDQIGSYKASRLPSWFKEGLAAFVSNGGGAHTVSEKQALDSIRSGKHFVPNETGGFIINKSASDWGLEHHMFYRQSMIFINFMATVNDSAYRKMLLAVQDGEHLAAALKAAYNTELKELWNDFLKARKE
jgi:hypothetical protein